MNEQTDLGTFDDQKSATEIRESSITEDEGSDAGIEFWPSLPESWATVSPDSVFDVNPRYDTNTDENPYIEMDALDTVLPYPKYIGTRNAADYSGKRFKTGDTLFARITPCTENGKIGFVPELDGKVGIGSTEYAVLSPKPGEIHPWFLYYVARSHPIRDYAISRMRGSTGRQRVPFDVFRREIDVPLPPMEEQQNIAAVLNNVDQIIDTTNKIIDQLARVKKGLIKEFYSEGYYDHEEWQEVDKQDAYVMTRADKIPAEWEIRQSGEIADVKTGHTPSTSVDEYWDGDISWVDIHDLTQLEKTVIETTDDTITEEGLENSGAKLLPEGTLVLCRTGAIGETAILGKEMATDQDQVTFECDESIVLPRYLMYLFEFATPQLERLSAGSTHDKVQLHFFSDLEIPLPSLDEQQEIVDALESVDDVVIANKEQLDGLKRLKTGLQQDLFSGDVRTSGKEIEIPDEVKNHEPE